jgi:outer membrane protein assembly factor BamB
MLWFRDTDFLMANRHGRAPTALVQSGRMFVEGLNGLRAQSIYNGRVLWEFSAPGILAAYNREHSIGAAWTGGNLCLGPNRVYLHDGRACFVLDAETGEQLARWEPPPHADGKPGVWGYIACDDGILFGSLVTEDYLIKCWSDQWDTSDQFTESTRLFALDADSGRLVWSFAPEHSIRHNAITMGGGRVYLIDRPPAIEDDIRYVAPPSTPENRRGTAPGDRPDFRGAGRENGTVPFPPQGDRHIFRPETDRKMSQSPGRLIALDQKTGRRVWQTGDDVFGTLLAYSAEEEAVWMGYQAAHQASRPSELGNRMALFDAADGRRRWAIEAEHVDRPILGGRTIYAPPGAWDLATGRKLPFEFERSYGCGTVIGSGNMLLFRSATLGYIDLATSTETQNYGGIRPGCWIPGVPAGGVFVMPDAASWCTCSYLNQGTVALKSRDD